MISYALFCRLRQLHDQQHLNAAQIARELQLDGRTVAYWIAQPTYLPRGHVPRTSRLEPFKGAVGIPRGTGVFGAEMQR